MAHHTSARPDPIFVATMLTFVERDRVDAAGEGCYRAYHRDTVSELFDDLKANRASAVLFSIDRCDGTARRAVGELVREFPEVPTVALLSHSDVLPHTLLSLGGTGVRQLVDVRNPKGWEELRRYLLNSHADGLQRRILSQLATDLAGAPPDCRRFFDALFLAPPNVRTVRMLGSRLDVLPSTLMSRFFRARLPAPKQYLATARLVRCARLFENHGFSIGNVANHLEYSSPQSFGRHVRIYMHLTAAEFRERFDGEGMFQHFREQLVLPHLDQLKHLRPLTSAIHATYTRSRRTPRADSDAAGVTRVASAPRSQRPGRAR